MKPPSGPKKQTQTKPILKRMNINFLLKGIMRVNPHSQSAKAGQIIQISSSPPPSVVGRESAFRRVQILGVYTTTLLQFSCAQQFLANTIYSILPNSPRQTLAAVSGVKMGLLQKLVF